MKKIIAENHDLKSGFIITQINESMYYYFEYDELEDIEGTNEIMEDLYITRDDYLVDFEITNFSADYDNTLTIPEILETIAYNRCIIKNERVTRAELEIIINAIKS